jgi:hypothetical protein
MSGESDEATKAGQELILPNERAQAVSKYIGFANRWVVPDNILNRASLSKVGEAVLQLANVDTDRFMLYRRYEEVAEQLHRRANVPITPDTNEYTAIFPRTVENMVAYATYATNVTEFMEQEDITHWRGLSLREKYKTLVRVALGNYVEVGEMHVGELWATGTILHLLYEDLALEHYRKIFDQAVEAGDATRDGNVYTGNLMSKIDPELSGSIPTNAKIKMEVLGFGVFVDEEHFDQLVKKEHNSEETDVYGIIIQTDNIVLSDRMYGIKVIPDNTEEERTIAHEKIHRLERIHKGFMARSASAAMDYMPDQQQSSLSEDGYSLDERMEAGAVAAACVAEFSAYAATQNFDGPDDFYFLARQGSEEDFLSNSQKYFAGKQVKDRAEQPFDIALFESEVRNMARMYNQYEVDALRLLELGRLGVNGLTLPIAVTILHMTPLVAWNTLRAYDTSN